MTPQLLGSSNFDHQLQNNLILVSQLSKPFTLSTWARVRLFCPTWGPRVIDSTLSSPSSRPLPRRVLSLRAAGRALLPRGRYSLRCGGAGLGVDCATLALLFPPVTGGEQATAAARKQHGGTRASGGSGARAGYGRGHACTVRMLLELEEGGEGMSG